jgi:hypothetical protein
MAEITNIKEAKSALDAGDISQDEFDNYQQQFATKTSDSNAIATDMGLPSGSPLVAGPVGNALGAVGNAVGSGVKAVGNVIGNVIGKTLPEGQFNENVGSQAPTFDPASGATLDTKKALEGGAGVTGSAKSSQEALANIGKTTEKALAGPAETGLAEAKRTINEAKKNFDNIQEANNNAQIALADSQGYLDKAGANATIDPDRYVKELGLGGMAVMGILAVLGGNGGKPVIDNLQRSIERDIDAQKQTYLNLMKSSEGFKDLAEKGVGIANLTTAANIMASNQVLTGANALVTHAMTQVQGKTATDRGTMLQGIIQNELLSNQMKFDEIRKGFVTSGNAASLNLIAEVLKRQGVINEMQVPYRPGYAPQVQQPKQPGFQQDQQQQQQSQPQQPQQPQPQQPQQEEVIPLEKDAKKYKSFIDALKSDSPGIFDKFLEKKFK